MGGVFHLPCHQNVTGEYDIINTYIRSPPFLPMLARAQVECDFDDNSGGGGSNSDIGCGRRDLRYIEQQLLILDDVEFVDHFVDLQHREQRS
jgi:hypothetical protein